MKELQECGCRDLAVMCDLIRVPFRYLLKSMEVLEKGFRLHLVLRLAEVLIFRPHLFLDYINPMPLSSSKHYENVEVGIAAPAATRGHKRSGTAMVKGSHISIRHQEVEDLPPL